MSNSNHKREIPSLLLEKMALGELSPREREFLSQNLTPQEEKAGRERIDVSNQEILNKYPAEDMARKIDERLSRSALSQRDAQHRWKLPLTVLAAVASILLVVFHRADPQYDDILLKGQEPRILVYRKLENGYERLKSGDIGRAGDTVQLRYIAGGSRYGVIFSIDGTGHVTQHFPVDDRGNTELETKGEVALLFAYELDDAPLFERFYFVAAQEPLSVEGILDKAKALGSRRPPKEEALDLPENMKQFFVTIRKAENG
jgi:hypothetical protein